MPIYPVCKSRLVPKHQTSNSILFGNTKQVIQDYDTVFDNSIPFRKNDLLRITYFTVTIPPGRRPPPREQLCNRSCSNKHTLCLGTETPAPVTGAAADEYNLNVTDRHCNASVTVARPAVLNLSQWGSGGYPQQPEANVKDVHGLPWPPPDLLEILRKTQFLRYYSVREAN